VPCKRGQEWLRTAGRPSILGEGLLERARAISLALLGATAAVGLAIVALAMNQGWPLVAGSSIPAIAPQHQAVGKATVAAVTQSPELGRVSLIDRLPSPARAGRSGNEHRGPGLAGSPTPADSAAEVVVAPSAPAGPEGNRPHGSPKSEPTPVAKQPQQASPTAPATPAAEPAAIPVSQPPAAAAPPGPTTSEAPVDESDSPSWSHGDGHGYGHDHDWDEDEGEDDWGGHGHGNWHGHGYGD